ncbi:MAG: c-type cytochrome [Verrucomicrobiales bacterium]|nr:c-type cytochrome [Verrucomicrobiales bacterium]MCP5556610.1 c-type cytochrome [Verrucomicrobiaceae bacterium]
MKRLVLLPLLAFVWSPMAASSEEVSPVQLHLWSGDLNVPDPVACTVDPQGRVYVSATTRRKAADLDIREHQMWIADDVSHDSVEAKREFYHRELAPGKLRVPRGGLKDHNKDGSIDWKDLTVHTERIYQLRDTDGDGKADKMTVFAEGFNTEVTGIAAGILYHDGWVYATIAPDLWRLKDTDDDGVADIREVVAHGFGIHIAYAGHDMHGPRLGPDGRIYWSIGDKGVNVTSKEGKNFYYPHEGCVMRVEPDGTGFEVFAHGLRNVQEVAFDDWGNVFGVDNDADMPGERERFVYITERSDSGWRCGHQYQKMASRWMLDDIWRAKTSMGSGKKDKASKDAPLVGGLKASTPLFITPPMANYSNGPAGFAHEPGTALGASLRGYYILNQFPSGVMDAFQIVPEGASFQMKNLRTLNNGVMGIGMSWGPDGSLYMADWVGGYPLDEKGAIWRVDEPSGRDSTERKETLALLSAGCADSDLPALENLLGHADQRVRVAAELELAKRKAWPALAAVAADDKRPLLARVHAIWGYGIGLRREKIAAKPMLDLLADAEPEVLAQCSKVLGEAKLPEDERALLIPLLANSEVRVRFQSAIALGKLGCTQATKPLLAAAAKEGGDAFMRHAIVTGLAGCATADLAAQTESKDRLQRLCAALALARQKSSAIADFLADADPLIVDEVARAIHDDAGIPDLLPKLASQIDGPTHGGTATVRRVINAALRVGTPELAGRVAQFAVDSAHPQALRLAAFQTLAVWTDPPRLDLLDGMSHPWATRDSAQITAALQPYAAALLGVTEKEDRESGIAVLLAHRLAAPARDLQSIISDTATDELTRAAALQLFASQNAAAPEFAAVLEVALAKESPSALRMAGLEVAFAHAPKRAHQQAQTLLKKGSLKERQHALKIMSKQSTADDLILAAFDAMQAGKIDPGLRLDVQDAAAARAEASQALAAKLAAYAASGASLIDDLAAGGDADIGKAIVSEHLGANCIACHTVESAEGSAVGPPLWTIGAQKDIRYLLESLLTPGAVVAPGFGMVSVTTKAGASVAGVVDHETADVLAVRAADGKVTEINKTDITAQTPPISVMPPMLGILTKHEIRDVAAYLSTRKKAPKGVSANEH